MNKQNIIDKLKSIRTIFIIIGIIFLCIGFFKAYVYSNPEWGDSINAYVGGDAYNYIINASFFTAYSILGMGSLIIATISGVGAMFLSVEDNIKKDNKSIIEDIENNLPKM